MISPSIQTLQGHSNTVFAVAVAPDSSFIVTGSWDGTVRLWSLGILEDGMAVTQARRD